MVILAVDKACLHIIIIPSLKLFEVYWNSHNNVKNMFTVEITWTIINEKISNKKYQDLNQ